MVLVRHGETPCNIDDIWHGWDGCELTERGRAQADGVARRLATERPSAVYSSDSSRACATATALAQQWRLAVQTDKRLRERNAGSYEGISVQKIVRERPNIWEERNADVWNWRPPEGESFRQVLERSLAALGDLERDHAGETVVAVTHMGPLRVLISHFADVPLLKTYEMTFDSTSVTIFRLQGDEAHIELLNDSSHLDEETISQS